MPVYKTNRLTHLSFLKQVTLPDISFTCVQLDSIDLDSNNLDFSVTIYLCGCFIVFQRIFLELKYPH